jgi:hypothetical protein
MSFIEKFSKNVYYYSLISVLKISILWSSIAYGKLLSDEILIARTKEEYRGFRGLTIVGAEKPVHPLLQFAWSLSQSNTPYAQQQVALIITGRVWGVDQNCSANEAERGIYFSLISRAKDKGVTAADFRPTVADATTVLGRHQRNVAIAFEVIAPTTAGTTGSSRFINYVTDRGAFHAVIRDVNVRLAVRHDNWGGLGREIPSTVRSRLCSSSSGVGEATRIQLTSSLLDLPFDERERLAGHAFDLFRSGDDRCNNAVLGGLGVLQSSAERDEFATRLSRMRRSPGCGKGDDTQHSKFIKQVKRFLGHSCPDTYNPEVIRMIATFVVVPEGERDELIDHFSRLGLTRQGLTTRLSAMKIVADAPQVQRERVIDQISQFASPDTIIELLSGLANHATRQLFIDQVSRLFTPGMSSQHRLQIIQFLRSLSPEAQQTFIDQVTRLLPLAAYQTDSWGVIRSITRVPEEHRTAFVIFILRNEAD